MLGFVVADLLFREFPDFDEGQKSKIKASLVSTTTLARQAERLALGEHLLLGRGEEKTGGRQKQALLADSYEALIAAIYLDGGVEHARAFIRASSRRWSPKSGSTASPATTTSRRCRSTCSLRRGGRRAAERESPRDRGRSKKEAEQEAARLALEKLRT